MPAPHEGRRYSRVRPRKELCIAWQSANQKSVSRVQAVGLGGLFIFTPNPPPVGTFIQLLIDLPGGEIRGSATVRSVKPGEGMGVKFVSMRPQDRSCLDKFLRQLLQPL